MSEYQRRAILAAEAAFCAEPDPRDAEIATLRAELAAARAETDRRVQAALEMAAGVADKGAKSNRELATAETDRDAKLHFLAGEYEAQILARAIRSLTPEAVAAHAEGQSRG